jgi:uncharacterized protein (TIGR00730 family)
MKRICVNCGSSPGTDPSFVAMARQLGRVLAERRIELVYGGADVGLMGAVADAALAAGGAVTGVIPSFFADRVSHAGLTRLHVVDSMHARKQMMFDLADGFIALPGGFGTIEELTELLTWAQLGTNRKPCGLLNVARYYDDFLAFLDHAVASGFMKQAHRDMLLVSDSPEELLARFDAYTAPQIAKWVGVKVRE